MPYMFEEALPGFEPVKDEISRDTDHAGLHIDCMFDEDNRIDDGAYINEETGERYDNSTFTDESVILETGHYRNRAPRALDREDDPGTIWLRANDPDFRKAA